MNHRGSNRVWLVVHCILAVSLAATTPARADDQDIIDYRQHVMNTLGEQSAAMTQILDHRAPADNFAIHAQVLAVTAATAKRAFEPNVPGGAAKADVWTKWADFSKRLDEFAAAAADLARISKEAGAAAAARKAFAALACQSCHDAYVERKQ